MRSRWQRPTTSRPREALRPLGAQFAHPFCPLLGVLALHVPEKAREVAVGTDPSVISDRLTERICDAFGLFGEPEHYTERLIRAYEEAGIKHTFLCPAHDMKTGHELPRAEVRAFGETIGPRLALLLAIITHPLCGLISQHL